MASREWSRGSGNECVRVPLLCVGRRKGDGENKEKENVDSCGCLSRGSQGKRQEVAECWPGHPQTCNCHMMPFGATASGKQRRGG